MEIMRFRKQDLEELLPIIKALNEGKTIQFKGKKSETWFNLNFNCENYDFNLKENDFRIKPEPQLVSFTFEDAEFLIGKAVKAKNNDAMAGLILSVTYFGVNIHPNTQSTHFDLFFKHYIFLDGTPCGKLVETSNK